jgi:hypothetical protein
VDVQCDARATRLAIENGRVAGVGVSNRIHRGRNVLIATGGLSYPATGSTGDGYDLAGQAGHSIIAPFPSLVALETEEEWPRKIQGTPIKNVSISATAKMGTVPLSVAVRDCPHFPPDRPAATNERRGARRKIADVFGEALWTHYGISGPAILDISRRIVLELRDGSKVELELDLRPSDTEEKLDEKLLHAIKKKGNVLVRSIIADWVPDRTAAVLLELAEIDPHKKMNQCSRSDRKRLVQTVKHLCLHVTRPRPIEESIVTGGGIALTEVNAKTIESRLVNGLYFAGELLDLDAPSGGYNLQAAFSTGYLVGESV